VAELKRELKEMTEGGPSVTDGEDGEPRLAPVSRAEWRAWLAAHHGDSRGAWVMIAKKRSGATGPTYEEAVEEALCFGWIDSRMHRLDDARFEQWFSPAGRGASGRGPTNSGWSAWWKRA